MVSDKLPRFSVWCIDEERWCGISPNHVLELSRVPYANMTSFDKISAVLRLRSLERRFPDHQFIIGEF